MIKTILMTLLVSIFSYAEDFQVVQTQPKKILCTEKKGLITFEERKKVYSPYDKNFRSLKLINCEKIEIKNLSFYTALFSSEVMDGIVPQKVLTYEVVLIDSKTDSLKTVRSDTVDQVDTSVDEVSGKFENILSFQWGISKKTGDIILKIDSREKNEKSSPYKLKFNIKSKWFENIY